MGRIRDLVFGPAGYAPPGSAEAPTFAVDDVAFPPSVVGMESYDALGSIAPRIDRKRAMQVPAVKRIRDLIAGTLGTLPLELVGPDRRLARWPLFDQPERDVPRSVTMAKTFENMLFEGVAWWRVVEREYRGWPVYVKRLDPAKVQKGEDGRIYVDGRHVPDADLIRFDSPTDGLLLAGARAIRTCLMLDQAAARIADGIPPVEYFTPADNVDPADDDTIAAFLDDWQEARRKRTAAYVPAALIYHSGGVDPDKLQLAEARQHAVLEISRLVGVDAEDVGVSTTSRTYQNGVERRKALIDYTLAPFMVAVQDALSMDNVTQRGYRAQLNVDQLLRADAKSRYEAYKVGREVGAITDERIAELEGVPAENVRALPAARPTPEEQTA
ncbi:phage portal protein [Nocardioides marmoraquaticus]